MGRLCSRFFPKKRDGTCFCGHGTNFIEHYECRGTILIIAANLSPVTKLEVGTSAVSRYRLSRSQKFIMVQDINCGQMRVSGCYGPYEFVLSAGAEAKSVTSNLPILSVLPVGFIYSFRRDSISCRRLSTGLKNVIVCSLSRSKKSP